MTTKNPEGAAVSVSACLLVLVLLQVLVGPLVGPVRTVAGASEQRKAAYTEEERRNQYVKRGHTFPFHDYTPNTTGWRRLMDQR